MILIGEALPLLLAATTSFATQQTPRVPDRAQVVRRLAATATLAAQEYRIGVVDGRVVAAPEVEEARLFLQEARRSAASLPPEPGRNPVASIDSLLRLVETLSPADTLDARVRALTTDLAAHYQVALDELPRRTPDLVHGAELYRAQCAGCHGDLGGGDGPMAAGLEPAPANLAAWDDLRDQSPLDFFRRVNIGVVGTAMPAFEDRLSTTDRWAVALYASTLRLPGAKGEVPTGLRSFPITGKMSDAQLLAALPAPEDGSRGGLERVAAVRAAQSAAEVSESAPVLDQVRLEIDSAHAQARTGHPDAGSTALRAYMTFEQVERELRGKEPGLAAAIEADFQALRVAASTGEGAELDAARERLTAGLERAGDVLGRQYSSVNLFVQSFVIMLREGLEAILIVGALMTFLAKMGAADQKRHVTTGVLTAIVASALTALALETIFHLSAAHQEALEGLTMVLATGVLFYVSYWLLSKMEVVKWNHFVKSKVHDAVSSGSALALASAAFLAVYREGFETVLFYKALVISAGSTAGLPAVFGGMVAGLVILIGVYFAVYRFGVRLPLKPFFGVTSAFLYYTAFTFAGAGIAELQAGGFIPATRVSWVPRIPMLGIYPTVETLAAQGLLLLLALVALLWTFAIEPRRMRAARRSAVDHPMRA